MTKKEFLARCATAYDAGLITLDSVRLLERWLEMVLRFEGGQVKYFSDYMEIESERTGGFHSSRVLANDTLGYSLIRFAAILRHPCQQCATDTKAWWTRPAFCEHKREASA